jgi:predicted esterase
VVPPVAFRSSWRVVDNQIDVAVWGAPRLDGTKVEVRDGAMVLASGVLAAAEGRCTAELSMPMPPPGAAWAGDPSLVVGGVAQSLCLGDPVRERTKAVARLDVEAERGCFTGEALPAIRFTDTLAANRLLNGARIETTYYDAAWQPVVRAKTPGRYGALAVVRQDGKELLRRRITLFRMAKNVDWNVYEPQVPDALAKEFGIAPGIAGREGRSTADLFRGSLRQGLARSPDAAVYLAALTELAPDQPPTTDRNSPWRRHQDWWYGLGKKLGEPGLRHAVMLPEGYDADPARRWPLILFLHGAGERGDDLQTVRKVGLPPVFAARRDLPFIVVYPQVSLREWWHAPAVLDLLDAIAKTHRVDPDRIYLTGLSMGGFGTWALLAEDPGRFAAAAPICGGGDPREVTRFKDVPVWAFHGTKDRTVTVDRSRTMVDALRQLHAPVALTEYPEAGHNAWDQTYRDDRLYAWFLANRRGAPVPPPTDGSATAAATTP